MDKDKNKRLTKVFYEYYFLIKWIAKKVENQFSWISLTWEDLLMITFQNMEEIIDKYNKYLLNKKEIEFKKFLAVKVRTLMVKTCLSHAREIRKHCNFIKELKFKKQTFSLSKEFYSSDFLKIKKHFNDYEMKILTLIFVEEKNEREIQNILGGSIFQIRKIIKNINLKIEKIKTLNLNF